jgi:hypothetical protein
MLKSLKQFAKKLSGGSKRTRKVSQKGGDGYINNKGNWIKIIPTKQTIPTITNNKRKNISKKNAKNRTKANKANAFWYNIQKREKNIRNRKGTKLLKKRLRTSYNQSKQTHGYYNKNNNNYNTPAAIGWSGFNENQFLKTRQHYANKNIGYRGPEKNNNIKAQTQSLLEHNNRIFNKNSNYLGKYNRRKSSSRKSSSRKSSRSPSPATNNI